MSVKLIPNVYGKADRKLLDKIESDRPENCGRVAQWWVVGGFICTQFDNGYYHCYSLQKDRLYGIILKEYYINKRGEMVEGKHYFSVPTKDDLTKWCEERNLICDGEIIKNGRIKIEII